MLLNNQVNTSFKAIAGVAYNNISSRFLICNAKAFGQQTAIPQGYSNPLVALVPSLRTSGQVASRPTVDLNFEGSLFGIGGLSATKQFDVDLSASGNVLGNVSSTPSFDINKTASIVATGRVQANIDWASRPSAFDIAQEVLNASKALYNIPGTIGEAINDGAAGGGGGGGGGTIIREDELAQGGTKAQITLNSAASTEDNLYEGLTLVTVSGTGAGQARKIVAYYGATRTAVVNFHFRIAPDSTTVYRIIP